MAKRSLWEITALAAALLSLAAVALPLFRDAGLDRDQHTGSARMRIVSLAPGVTEILFALGVGDRLVGVTNCCNQPEEATRIAQVGGFGAPNIETLLALSPDLVIATGFEHKDLPEVLHGSDVRVLDLRIRNFEELFDAIHKIGDAVGRPDRADRLVRQMRADLEAIAPHDATAKARRPRVFVEITDHPLMTAGAGSFLDDVVTKAGGANVAHELPQPYPRINPEKVIEWDPEVIVLTSMSRGGDPAAELSRRIGWSDIAAVWSGRIVDDIDPDLLFRPGPRLIEGVRTLAARIHETPQKNIPQR